MKYVVRNKDFWYASGSAFNIDATTSTKKGRRTFSSRRSALVWVAVREMKRWAERGYWRPVRLVPRPC